MRPDLFFVTTALAVSLDSLLCGFTLAAKSVAEPRRAAFRRRAVLGVMLAVTFLCLFAAFLGAGVSSALKGRVNGYGGAVLCLVGGCNFITALTGLRHEKNAVPTAPSPLRGRGIFLLSLTLGLAIGTDGAFAAASMAILGYSPLLSALAVVFCHFLLVETGIWLSRLPGVRVLARFSPLPPLILIGLGVSRLGIF